MFKLDLSKLKLYCENVIDKTIDKFHIMIPDIIKKNSLKLSKILKVARDKLSHPNKTVEE